MSPKLYPLLAVILFGAICSTMSRAIDQVLPHADCQSAIQPIDNRRYGVAQTGSLSVSPVVNRLRLRSHLRELCQWPCSHVGDRRLVY